MMGGKLKRFLAAVMAVLMVAGTMPMVAWAADIRIYSEKIPRGKTGKNLTVSFTVEVPDNLADNNFVAYFDRNSEEIWDEDEEAKEYGYAFPFEVTGSLPTQENPKSIGKIGKKKTVSLSGRLRSDLTEGYYRVPVFVEDRNQGIYGNADLQVWVSRSSTTDDDDEDTTKTYDFVLGEGQNTPDGTYPNVMNFALNLRNNSPATVYNVKASIGLDADDEKFPFEINDANYDRMFEKISVDETVQLGYSFAIRKDAYSGYYPISMKIFYSNSSTGEELETFETSFFVRIHNKEREDEYGEFNEHDRTKARLIVDGFRTDPETIIAGEDFELYLSMKNASSNVSASNILYTLESEKVSDSAVFTMESGASSIAMDSLGPGATREIRVHLSSKAGIDQRSYALTVKARYDSPEFKNADESMTVDIPIKQIARLNTGTFEILPDTISVGEESNIMFPINNTGKVILYNVMVRFEADSINPTDTYVGNIKPGETGNVDTMITGAAPTMDDGKIKVIISYEDENGDTSEEEKELSLFVTEDMSDMEDMEMGNFEDVPMEEPGLMDKLKEHMPLLASGAAAILAIITIVMGVKYRKLKKKQEEFDDDEEV